MPFAPTRRQMLASTVAAGATFAGLPGWLSRAAADRSADHHGVWPLGIQSYTLRKYNVTEAVRHIEAMGLKYVEFFGGHFPVNASDEQLLEMRDLLAKAGITISAHGVNHFSADHDANRKVFDFAKRAGIPTITADPAPDSFDSLDKLVEEYGIRIAIHNHGPGHRYDKLTDVTKAIKDRHRLIGACVDTGHVLRSDEDPIRWVRELGNRVHGFHVKDVAERQGRTRNVVIGQGHLDVVGLFQAIRDIKFPADGALSLEYEANPDNPIDDVKQILVVAREAIAEIGALG